MTVCGGHSCLPQLFVTSLSLDNQFDEERQRCIDPAKDAARGHNQAENSYRLNQNLELDTVLS